MMLCICCEMMTILKVVNTIITCYGYLSVWMMMLKLTLLVNFWCSINYHHQAIY